jgi:hypothetical protein
MPIGFGFCILYSLYKGAIHGKEKNISSLYRICSLYIVFTSLDSCKCGQQVVWAASLDSCKCGHQVWTAVLSIDNKRSLGSKFGQL